VEQGQVLQENLPAEEEAQEKTEEIKMSDFLSKIFKLEGVQGFGKPELKKTIIGELLYDNAEAFRLITLPSQALNERLEEEVLMVLEEADDLDKEALRLDLQRKMIFIFKNNRSIPKGIKEKKKNLKLLASMEGLMLGSGYISEPRNEYIPIGKYKAHKTKLMGGKLQIRSSNNHQIHNLKSQVITKNIRDILLKLNKNEPINFSDIDNLNTNEKDQLYMIGKQLHITQLFDIPSTLKSQEDKLKDDFLLLRGSLIAGNNNPELLRKFKIVLLKMKNNKLISL
jgi:hypothetical protein